MPVKESAKPKKNEKPVLKTVSPREIIAAGGPTKYALTQGVDPKTAKISGVVRVSRKETDAMRAMLRKRH